MLERFEGLPREKQQKVINAAYKVFSTYGYKKASTNDIIAEAGISKGLLFHYFKNKKGLYIYIYELSSKLLAEKLLADIDSYEQDLLKRIRTIVTAKIDLIRQYPELFDFLKSAYFEQEPEIKKIVEKNNRKMAEQSYKLLYSNLDMSLFREDIDWQLAVQTIYTTLEKWSEGYMLQHMGEPTISIVDEAMKKELDRYMNFFERSFYKTTT